MLKENRKLIAKALEKAKQKMDDWNAELINGIERALYKTGKITEAERNYLFEYINS